MTRKSGRSPVPTEQDVESLDVLIARIHDGMARLAEVKRRWAALRAEVEGEPPPREPPEALPMTAAPPVRPTSKGHGRGKKAAQRENALDHRQGYVPIDVPTPVRIEEGDMICNLGDQTLSIPMRSEKMVLGDGVVATVRRLAETRFAGLAVHAVIDLGPSRTGKKRRGNRDIE